MRRLRPLSIRWWLAALVVAVALPLLLLLTWIYLANVQREQGEARATALRIARATANRMQVLHQESRSLLQVMASRRAIRDFDGRSCDLLFAVIDFFPQYADLYFFDNRGSLACVAGARGEDVLLSSAARPWVEAALRDGRIQPGRPMIHSIASHWVSVLAADVRRTDGSPGGTLVLLQLPAVVGREALPPGSVVTIVDRSGTIVARSQDSQAWSGRSARHVPVVSLALKQREGIAQAIGVDGVSRQYGFTTIPEVGWSVYVGVPTAAVMQPVRQMFVRGVIGGLAMLLILTAIAFMLMRQIERPVHALATAADSVARGEYVKVDASMGPLEIATLGSAFNDMVERRLAAEEQLREGEGMLKALSERLLVAQEEERGRIARELHDDLGQSLTALKMDIGGLLRTMPANPPSPIADRILRTIDLTVTAVQRISSELRPSVLDDLGLIAAIESEALLFEERTGIECELSMPVGAAIEHGSATAIYRIVQEALTNVARHSNASRVELRLRERADEILLEIRDDGRGITRKEIDDPTSLGLIGIRERAHLAGGTVEFEGVEGRGTIVSLRIPLSTGTHS
ncbi:MAG TPA: ATP-binding protein [Thermoanaerobaculia bacterium]